MSNDNMIQFPGKAGNKMADKVEKHEKVTQQQALNALNESGNMVKQLMGSLQKIAQAQIGLEQLVQQLDTNVGVLVKMLMDKGIMTVEDMEAAWDKYVAQPQEQGLVHHIEEMKLASAEEAYYAVVLEKIKDFNWPDREVEGKIYSGKQVRDFYLQLIINTSTRASGIDEVKTFIADLPELHAVVPEEIPVPKEPEIPMPDCHYCGKDDCPVCNELKNIAPVGVPISEVLVPGLEGTETPVNIHQAGSVDTIPQQGVSTEPIMPTIAPEEPTSGV